MTERVSITRARGDRPLYVQLAEEIAHGIRRGDLLPGDRVASEPELVRRHGVSRATAVRALEHLEQTGLVRREQGRGTFVEEPRLVQRNAQLGSFSDQVRRHGHVPAQRLVQIGPPAPDGETAALHRWLGADVEVLELVRLRLVDGEPVGLHTTLLDRGVAARAGVDADSLHAEDASLYALLDAAGVRVAEADEHLQALPASEREAALLGVPAGSALMRVLRVSYGTDGAPIEVVDARYRGDRFDYSVSLVRRERVGQAVGGPRTEGEHDEDQVPHDARDHGRARGDGGGVRQVGRRGLE
jgi:GntR family transcriptional regulator